MKKLILGLYYSLIAIIICSCTKKASNEIQATYEVHYYFDMHNVSSDINYTSIQDGKTVNLNDIVEPEKTAGVYPPLIVSDHVKPGDHVRLEMYTQLKPSSTYQIDIAYHQILSDNSSIDNLITSSSKTTTDASGKTTIVLEKTFTADDFK